MLNPKINRAVGEQHVESKERLRELLENSMLNPKIKRAVGSSMLNPKKD